MKRREVTAFLEGSQQSVGLQRTSWIAWGSEQDFNPREIDHFFEMNAWRIEVWKQGRWAGHKVVPSDSIGGSTLRGLLQCLAVQGMTTAEILEALPADDNDATNPLSVQVREGGITLICGRAPYTVTAQKIALQTR